MNGFQGTRREIYQHCLQLPYDLESLCSQFFLLIFWTGKTILQLAFRNGYIHEGNEVKFTTDNKPEVITTLKTKEGWAYIEYKKLFHPSVNTFLKTLLDVSDTFSCKQALYYNKV